MPINIIGIDQYMNTFPPYSLILYQFSSDSNDFGILIPYHLFIFIFLFRSGIERTFIKIPIEILENPTIILFIFYLPYPLIKSPYYMIIYSYVRNYFILTTSFGSRFFAIDQTVATISLTRNTAIES